MPRVEFQSISKSFAGRSVLNRIEFTIADGEYFMLLGPSGSGKTTLLRLLAGLEEPDAGTLRLDGRDLRGVDPADRDLSLVFQNHALYPQLTVRGNLALPLRLRRVAGAEIASRVAETASVLGLTRMLDQLPEGLSGGERQRVALGRALVARTRILLLDEPFSDLDPGLRLQLRGELRRLSAQYGLTVLHVTHDQREALALGDRMGVLHAGLLQQVATPREIYERPANAFLARFIGEPAMNLWRLPDGAWQGVRPEHLRLFPPGECLLSAPVVRSEFGGREQWLILGHPDGEIVCPLPAEQPTPVEGSVLSLFADARNLRRFER